MSSSSIHHIWTAGTKEAAEDKYYKKPLVEDEAFEELKRGLSKKKGIKKR